MWRETIVNIHHDYRGAIQYGGNKQILLHVSFTGLYYFQFSTTLIITCNSGHAVNNYLSRECFEAKTNPYASDAHNQ
jgi:hypothetical protein